MSPSEDGDLESERATKNESAGLLQRSERQVQRLKSRFQDSPFSAEVDRIQSARGKATFETRVEFTILGAPVARVATKGPSDVFETNGDWHILLYDDQARTGLVQFANGSGLALPVLPGFVGTVLVQADEIVSIAY